MLPAVSLLARPFVPVPRVCRLVCVEERLGLLKLGSHVRSTIEDCVSAQCDGRALPVAILLDSVVGSLCTFTFSMSSKVNFLGGV